MREFDAKQLKSYIERTEQGPFLLDVRQPWEYDVCRIDGSVLIPMGLIPARLNELDKDRETVVICHHGIRSRQVAHYMEQNGFTCIINLNGGVNAWAKDVDSNMATY